MIFIFLESELELEIEIMSIDKDDSKVIDDNLSDIYKEFNAQIESHVNRNDVYSKIEYMEIFFELYLNIAYLIPDRVLNTKLRKELGRLYRCLIKVLIYQQSNQDITLNLYSIKANEIMKKILKYYTELIEKCPSYSKILKGNFQELMRIYKTVIRI